MNNNDVLRAIGRALMNGDTWTAGVLARDLAPACDDAGVLAPYASIRTLLDGVAGLRPADTRALDLANLGDLNIGQLRDALIGAGIQIHTESGPPWRANPDGARPILAVATWLDGMPGRGEDAATSLTIAVRGAVRALLVARYPEPEAG